MPLFVDPRHPLVVRATFVDVPSDGELQSYLARAEGLLEERVDTPFIVIVDARSGGTPPVAHLKLHAAFLRRNADALRQGLLGVVFLASKPMVRGALKALFWLQPSTVQVEVRSSLSEGLVVAAEWLAERGVATHVPSFVDDPAVHGERIVASVADVDKSSASD